MAVTAPSSFLSLSLLLLLLLANGAGASTVEYQTLVLTPLQKPHALRDDYLLDETLVDSGAAREGESDLLSTTAAATSSLQVRVAHRDSILASAAANSTAEEILRLRLDRDAARVSAIRASLAAARSGSGSGSPTATAPSPPATSPRDSHLLRGARVGRVALGCGHDNEGLFVAAAGLLGLGRGALSFPSQAARRFGRRFSYCLVDRTSSSSSSSSSSSAAPTPATPRTSSMVFGDAAAAATGPDAAFTPMVRNPKMETFYYVERGRLPRPRDGPAPRPVHGRGGAIVDSGTSVTRLARAAYAAVRDAFRAGAAAGLGGEAAEVAGGFSLFDTCYDLAGRDEVRVPTVALHLAGGAQVSLPAENYLIPVDTKGTFCFAFAGTDSGVSILGNIQQQGFRVVFDGDRDRSASSPRDAS
ncbi:Protein ASPARTIC PROTEASE IN GUARD CELL 1 [Ananas comosus]|uniref:Protein ASPARTIC PROTEASE IN GUARD CELL 1 n=1 Tax=Ananas comosus TaxID=4615 RepID=A0A199UVF4_ANACO|nr:Protein ASPARTIC PROTEASE IN GUARD CELL 1 [Ananas comosus]